MNLLDELEDAKFESKDLVTADELCQLLAEHKPTHIAIDSESPHFNWWHPDYDPFCFTFSWGLEHSYFVPCLRRSTPEQDKILAQALGLILKLASEGRMTIVMHNAKYDLHVIKRFMESVGFGHLFVEVPFPHLQDTMIMSPILDEQRGHALKALSDTYQLSYGGEDASALQVQIKGWIQSMGKVIGTEPGYDEVPDYLMVPYAVQDAYITLELYRRFAKQMERDDPNGKDLKRIYELEMKLMWILFWGEERGMCVDMDFVYDQMALLTPQLEHLQQQCIEVTGMETVAGEPFNPGSTPHVAQALKAIGRYDEKACTNPYTGKPNIPEWILKDIDHPVAQTILKYREVQKVLSSYFGKIKECVIHEGDLDIVHPNVKQIGARTGRMSVTEPALQTLPRKKGNVRGAFIARPGHKLVFADYSQQEYRVLAHYSKAIGYPEMGDFFIDDTSIDFHAATAAMVYGKDISEVTSAERSAAKNLNFAIAYGAGKMKLAQMLGFKVKKGPGKNEIIWESEEDEETVTNLMDKYHSQFPGAKKLKYGTSDKMKARQHIRTIFGRRHREKDGKFAFKALNSLIQGTSADLTKAAMVQLDEDLKAAGSKAAIVMAVHDELIVECPDEEVDQVKEIMTKAMVEFPQLTVPLDIDINIAERWSDAK